MNMIIGCLKLGLISMFVGIFLLVGCQGGVAEDRGAPDFTLSDINGRSVSLSDFRGKVVILDFFASWCPPCRRGIPDFVELQREYGPEGLAIVGIALENLRNAKAFASRMGMNYPVLVGDDRVNQMYGPVRSIPTTFIIDREGNIVKKYIGFRPKSTFEEDIRKLL